MFQGFFCLFVKLHLLKDFDTSYSGTEDFVKLSLSYKYLYMVASMVRMRCTYYVGWKLSQASVNFCGLGYNRKMKDLNVVESFDKIDICNLTKIELDLNPRIRIQYWNRSVHLWLKYYIFIRLININKKPFYKNKSVASQITFAVSAMWHGYYPVYYLFFFEYFAIEQVSTYFEEVHDLYNKVETWSFFPKLIYRIFVMSLVNYFGLTFSILTLEGNYNYYRAFHFIPLFILFGPLVLISLFGGKKKRHISQESKTVDNNKKLE